MHELEIKKRVITSICSYCVICQLNATFWQWPIFDQRAATIVLLLLAASSVLAFAGAVVSIM